jgi:hypothetical protein
MDLAQYSIYELSRSYASTTLAESDTSCPALANAIATPYLLQTDASLTGSRSVSYRIGPCWDRTSDRGIKSGCRWPGEVSGAFVNAHG